LRRCVYCLETGALRDDQVILRGERMYTCVPRGQLVEGFAAIAPYACLGSLSQLPPESLAELEEMVVTLGRFYSETYDCERWLLYEQGRGGGGLTVDPQDGFPIHTHLCALPLDVDLHAALADRSDLHAELAGRFQSAPIRGVGDLADVVDGPYLYVERRDRQDRRDARVYRPSSSETRRELESSRIRLLVAALAGTPERGDWRDYPGDAELEAAVARFEAWQRVSGAPRR
jgi:diadenosine tetraphosphate (Ap4A) HIT family hydrolase